MFCTAVVVLLKNPVCIGLIVVFISFLPCKGATLHIQGILTLLGTNEFKSAKIYACIDGPLELIRPPQPVLAKTTASSFFL
jgi:hypothetical protein